MPRMFPSCDTPVTDSSAERDLYRALTKQLDDDWVVIHSLPWLNNEGITLSSGECDFLVLHPQHGILAIEAKTGVLAPDRETGKWRSANGTLIQDPVRQAERSIHHLEHELAARLPSWRNNSENRLPFGHAVALPHTRALPPQGMLPPHVKPDLFILENDMADLDKHLRSILSRYDRRCFGDTASQMPSNDFEAVVKALLPEFRIVPSLASRLREESAEMARLTAQQSFFLQCCRFAPRLAVYGTSGSGKTLLVCEEARLHAADGAEVLFLCYNRNLAEHVSCRLNDGASGVKVATFHALCREAIESAGMRYDVPSAREEAQRFFDEISPELFMDALPAYAPRYDVILVDEMQDFRTTW